MECETDILPSFLPKSGSMLVFETPCCRATGVQLKRSVNRNISTFHHNDVPSAPCVFPASAEPHFCL